MHYDHDAMPVHDSPVMKMFKLDAPSHDVKTCKIHPMAIKTAIFDKSNRLILKKKKNTEITIPLVSPVL